MNDSPVLNWDLPDEQDVAPVDFFEDMIALYQELTDRARKGIVLPDPLPPLISESGTIIFRDFEIE